MARKAESARDARMAAVLEAGEGSASFTGTNFFSNANKNLNTGAALNANNLGEAMASLRKMTDDKGDLIAVRPVKLLVPAELQVKAQQIVNATLTDGGNTNVLAGALDVVVNPFLKDASSWYLIGDENPMIMQDREPVKLVAVSPEDSGNTAISWLFYTYARYEAAYGDWHYVIKNKA